MSSRTDLLRLKQEMLTIDDQVADSTAELNNALGLPLDTRLQLESLTGSMPDSRTSREFVKSALTTNPEIQSAKEQLAKARTGLEAAKDDYLPDVSAYVQHTYQNGAPFVSHNNESFGGKMSWNIFDAGKRRSVVAQRQAQIEQAEQNLQRLQGHVAVDVEKAYRNVERLRLAIQLSEEMLSLKTENERIAKNQATAGLIQQSKYKETMAEKSQAEFEVLKAQLACELAVADLHKAVGLLP